MRKSFFTKNSRCQNKQESKRVWKVLGGWEIIQHAEEHLKDFYDLCCTGIYSHSTVKRDDRGI